MQYSKSEFYLMFASYHNFLPVINVHLFYFFFPAFSINTWLDTNKEGYCSKDLRLLFRIIPKIYNIFFFLFFLTTGKEALVLFSWDVLISSVALNMSMDELLQFAFFYSLLYCVMYNVTFYLPVFHFDHSYKMGFLNVSNNSYHKEYEMKGKLAQK